MSLFALGDAKKKKQTTYIYSSRIAFGFCSRSVPKWKYFHESHCSLNISKKLCAVCFTIFENECLNILKIFKRQLSKMPILRFNKISIWATSSVISTHYRVTSEPQMKLHYILRNPLLTLYRTVFVAPSLPVQSIQPILHLAIIICMFSGLLISFAHKTNTLYLNNHNQPPLYCISLYYPFKPDPQTYT